MLDILFFCDNQQTMTKNGTTMTKKGNNNELNPRQKAFVREYKLNGGNATKAAIKAGYSKKRARITGSTLVANRNIQAEIKKHEERIEKKYDVSEERIIRELELIGFSDLKNHLDIDPDTGAIRAKGFDEMGNSSRALESISEDRVIKENSDGTQVTVYDKRKFKTHSKIQALDMLGKFKGMWKDKDDQSGITIVINAEPHGKV